MKKTALHALTISVLTISVLTISVLTISLALAIGVPLFAQDTPAPPLPPDQNAPSVPAAPAYTPKYRGDPARSGSESAALAYMRVVMRAQLLYNRKNGHYATALPQL